MVGDFSVVSPDWGYIYKNASSKVVEEFVASNAIEILLNQQDPSTYHHCNGHGTNPALSFQ